MTLLTFAYTSNVQVPLAGWLEANYHIFREDLDPRNQRSVLQRFSKLIQVAWSGPVSCRTAGTDRHWLEYLNVFEFWKVPSSAKDTILNQSLFDTLYFMGHVSMTQFSGRRESWAPLNLILG